MPRKSRGGSSCLRLRRRPAKWATPDQPPGQENEQGQGRDTAAEAREKGREFGQDVAAEARDNRENAGRGSGPTRTTRDSTRPAARIDRYLRATRIDPEVPARVGHARWS